VRVLGVAQVREAGARDDERAAGVDRLHEVEAFDLEVAHRGEVDGACVVDHDVDPAEALHRLRDRVVHGARVADVADDRQRLAAGGLDLVGRCVGGAG
jgi:hypothetical protein